MGLAISCIAETLLSLPLFVMSQPLYIITPLSSFFGFVTIALFDLSSHFVPSLAFFVSCLFSSSMKK